MKGNENECHVLISTDETMQVNIVFTHINNSKYEKLLGIKTDCKVSFGDSMENIFKKAGRKLNALTREAQNTNTKIPRLIMNAFFSLQFNYCPLHVCSTVGC